MSSRLPLLAIIVALLAGALAYQAPARASVAVGWLGDQLFLPTTERLGPEFDHTWYADEIADHGGGSRSRWTRRASEILLPGLAPASDLVLTLDLRGWPADALNPAGQPRVDVEANGTVIGSVTPRDGWETQRLTIPAAVARRSADLTLRLLASETFTSTRTYDDPQRRKGIRVDALTVQGALAPALPAPLPLLWLALIAGFGVASLRASTSPRRNKASKATKDQDPRSRLATTLLIGVLFVVLGLLVLGLAFARVWTAALLPWVALAALLLWLLAARRAVGALLRGWAVRASGPLETALLPVAALLCVLLIGLFAGNVALGSTVVVLLLMSRFSRLNLAERVLQAAQRPAVIGALFGVFLVGWLGWSAAVALPLPYVGHADYADNALVARNLAAGRGWVTDHITQFYKLYPAVTRPQETWPLLQPVWIAAFFLFFGPVSWAAKLPNLLFTLALGLLVYRIGAQLWDRRVGLLAAILTLANQFFFYMVLYTTSDLAFVVFALAALWLVWRMESPPTDHRPPAINAQLLPPSERRERSPQASVSERSSPASAASAAGLLTGLMLLQKPGSGALIAVGMGLWLLWRAITGRVNFPAPALAEPVEASGIGVPSEHVKGGRGVRAIARRLAPAILWASIAIAVLSPYLLRNLALSGRPFASTESLDAWVLEYTDWEDIYKIYTPQFNLSETDGLPDRSWVLRWGFDRTLAKMARQVQATVDYLLPTLPLGTDVRWVQERDARALLGTAGAWLTLLGVLAAAFARRQRPLLGLLLLAFGPYTLFLITYWHANEERYFVTLIPWLALFAAAALWWLVDRLRHRGEPLLALLLLLTLTTAAVGSSVPGMTRAITETAVIWRPDVSAYTWVRDHTAPGTVIMGRGPWQLNWQADRPALMVPNTADRTKLLQLARLYNARYLVRETLTNPSRETKGVLDGLVADGTLRQEYASPPEYILDQGRQVRLVTRVYSFAEDYGNVPPLAP